MRSEDFWRVIGLFFVTLAAIIGTLAAIHLLSTTQLWTSSGAYWVQAVGSLAAIGGAVWIFRTQVHLQRTDAIAIAMLASARIYPRLENLILEYEGLIIELNGMGSIDGNPTRIREIYDLVRNPPDWTVDELSKLAPLPGECALHFARGLGGLTTMRLFMRKFVNSKDFLVDSSFRRRSTSEASKILEGAVDELLAAALTMKG